MEILLVDDDADFVLSMKEALYGRGYTVYTAADGMEACKILSATAVDLIMSDIRMPNMDGIRLHTWLRKLRKDARTKFVFLSAYCSEHAEHLSLVPERDFYFAKTTTAEEIIRFVDRLLFGKYADVWI